jgi:hypothetical protein
LDAPDLCEIIGVGESMFGVGAHPHPQRLFVMLIEQSNDRIISQ